MCKAPVLGAAGTILAQFSFDISQDALGPVARGRSRVASVNSFTVGELEAASCKSDNFAFATIFAAFALVFGLDSLFANLAHHLHDIVGLVDGVQELLIAAFEKLKKSPNSNVLESGVA